MNNQGKSNLSCLIPIDKRFQFTMEKDQQLARALRSNKFSVSKTVEYLRTNAHDAELSSIPAEILAQRVEKRMKEWLTPQFLERLAHKEEVFGYVSNFFQKISRDAKNKRLKAKPELALYREDMEVVIKELKKRENPISSPSPVAEVESLFQYQFI